MAAELKRTNHVTPSNFLGLLRSFRELYDKKRAHIEGEAVKLENGLKKLDDTRVSVAKMGEKLREMQKLGARLQQECDSALVVIVQQKQEASDQAKEIEQQEAKLTTEEQDIKEEKVKAKTELEKVMPAFEAAKKALKSLDRRDLGEIRTYVTPLPLTAKVMEAVMVLRGTVDTSWAEAKKQLSDIQFIPQLLNYEIESISDTMLKKIDRYVIDPDFRPEKVQRESAACMSLCTWVHAVGRCAHAQREVAPKQQALAIAEASLQKNAKALEEARTNLKAINEKLDVLRAEHASKVTEKDKLAAEARDTEIKINRASRLVDGLASERVRWEGLIGKYKAELEQLAGNCVVAASFMAYAGPFPHQYRLELMSEGARSVVKMVAEAKLPFSPELSVTSFIADRVQVREWTSHGLPNDDFSLQNGMLVMPPTKWIPRSRWPLIIDPEGQANKWIRATEGSRNLRIVGPNQDDFMRTIENAVQFGLPVLLEDVGPELDPSLDPILVRRVVRLGSREVIRMDDGKELEFHPDFKLYVTTKLANPSFGPELTTKMTVVNFAVREQGLQ
jgi:dynein heavy chain